MNKLVYLWTNEMYTRTVIYTNRLLTIVRTYVTPTMRMRSLSTSSHWLFVHSSPRKCADFKRYILFIKCTLLLEYIHNYSYKSISARVYERFRLTMIESKDRSFLFEIKYMYTSIGLIAPGVASGHGRFNIDLFDLWSGVARGQITLFPWFTDPRAFQLILNWSCEQHRAIRINQPLIIHYLLNDDRKRRIVTTLEQHAGEIRQPN